MTHVYRLLFLLALLSLPVLQTGCESASTKKNNRETTATADGPPSSGLWEQLRRSRQLKEQRMRGRKARAERIARTRERFSPEVTNQMEALWARFMLMEPTWAEGRDEWRSLGSRALETFAENVIVLMVRAYDIGNGVLFKHAQRELVELQDQSIPLLVNGLAGSHGDNVIRDHCKTVLATIGKPALGELQGAFDGADPSGQLAVTGAISRLALPESVPFLGTIATTRGDFRLRITAIEGIGRAGGPQHSVHLIKCLTDDDISVRKFSAGYIGAMGSKKAITPLIRCLASCEAQDFRGREQEVAQNCRRSLRQLTGERFTKSSDWRDWWQAQSK